MDFENTKKSQKKNISNEPSQLLPVFIGAATASIIAHPFEVCKIRAMISQKNEKKLTKKTLSFSTLKRGLLVNTTRNALVYTGGVYIGRSIWPIMN